MAPGRVCLFLMVLLLPVAMTAGTAHAGTAGDGPTITPHYRLSVSVDPQRSRITGYADITAGQGEEIVIYPSRMKITELHVGKKKIDVRGIGDSGQIFVQAAGTIHLAYEATIRNSEDNVLNDEEIILKDSWYPAIDGLCTYRLRANLPTGFIAVSEGDPETTEIRGDRVIHTFDFHYPYSDGITLAASRKFVVSRGEFGPIAIYTYLSRENAHRADLFIEWTKRYLGRYQSLIGPFPYKRFSIVENSLPSAYSMPTYILMTRNYIREGDVEETPLGHEIVHQWFGNSVYADFDTGNWIEGLTIYFADHFDAERKREGADCRKRILVGYENYVTEKNVFPLTKFLERFDYASRSIGYGKSAFVFHMLRQRFGDEIFFETIRRFVKERTFRLASWEDLRESFESNTGVDLTVFFRQWVLGVGIPDLELSDVRVEPQKGGEYHVHFSVRQKTAVYNLRLPCTVYFRGGKKSEWITIDRESNHYSLTVAAEPQGVALDEEYHVFRKLTLAETPPTVERLLTDEKTLVIPPPSRRGLYANLMADFGEKGVILKFTGQRPDVSRRFDRGGTGRAMRLRSSPDQSLGGGKGPRWEQVRRGPTRSTHHPAGDRRLRKQFLTREVAKLTDADLGNSSILILGTDNPALERLGLEPVSIEAGFGIIIIKNPLDPRHVVAIAAGRAREDIEEGRQELTNYRKFSLLLFDGGTLVRKESGPAENGIRFDLSAGLIR